LVPFLYTPKPGHIFSTWSIYPTNTQLLVRPPVRPSVPSVRPSVCSIVRLFCSFDVLWRFQDWPGHTMAFSRTNQRSRLHTFFNILTRQVTDCLLPPVSFVGSSSSSVYPFGNNLWYYMILYITTFTTYLFQVF